MTTNTLPRFASVAAAFLLVGCSAAPATQSPSLPPAASLPAPTAPGVVTQAPSPSPRQLAPSQPFTILPAEPPAGFESPIACSGAIGSTDPVAVVQLKSPTGDDLVTVLRDYRDPAHPIDVCTIDGDIPLPLIDAEHLVIRQPIDGGADLFAIVDLPAVRYRWFQLPALSGADWSSELIAVGPGLDRIVWKAVHVNGTDTDAIHVTTTTADQIVATLPDTNAGRCGEPEDSHEGAYTADESLLYVLNQPIAVSNSLVVFEDGHPKLTIHAPAGDWSSGAWPSMAVWSPTSPVLYFHEGGDIWTWTPSGGKEAFLRGVTWFRPTISADGRYLAYEADGGVYLVDLLNGAKPVMIGAGAADPVFLDATHLWFEREGVAGGCSGGAEPSPVIYDAATGHASTSDVLHVLDVWPSTSSNH